MTPEHILTALKSYKRFLICSHIHPEGDAVASQLAMAVLLRQLGKEVRIVNQDPVPANLLFLPGIEHMQTQAAVLNPVDFDAVVVLDCGAQERVGTMQEMIGQSDIINIDHHISNTVFGRYHWVEPTACSAGEMVYDLFIAAGVPLDYAAAFCLYVAIMTDTGSFRYTNTTPRAHQIAAHLLSAGIPPNQSYEAIYETKSFAALKLLGAVLADLRQTSDGTVAWCAIPAALLQSFALTPEHTEHIIDVIRMVEGIQVAALFRELPDHTIKVSLRAKTSVDVNAIARRFGGGGHRAASGCVIAGELSVVSDSVLTAIAEQLRSRP